MTYHEFKPGKPLQPYVKCYYVYESASGSAFEDTVFPCGSMEIIFNLGSGNWQTRTGDAFVTTPAIELWGQVLSPLRVRSIGRNTMLGIRFYPHAAASILHDKVNLFNNQVANYGDVLGNAVLSLHNQLQEVRSWTKRLALVEVFLLQQLSRASKRLNKVAVVSDLMQALRQPDIFNTMETVATRYGISARYMQQLFVQYTGLTPKLFSQINRFQNSLQLIREGNASLTSIAYECGYADQSHFIREFKSFTGLTPSGYSINNSPVALAASRAEQQEYENTLVGEAFL
jgi:AraC-like DNA-binding protein